jgi:hypothetical protein
LRCNFSGEIKSGAVIVCQKAIWDKPEETLKFYLNGNGNGDAADGCATHKERFSSFFFSAL